MNLSSSTAILRRYGLRPDKSFGQHFLVNEVIVDRIVDAAEIRPDELVLEIGAGAGVLTRRLIERARRVIAVEIDRRLADALRQATASHQNVTLIAGDILDVDIPALCEAHGSDRLVVVGNLPYQITGPLIERLLTYRTVIRRAVIMVQEEVGRRLSAAPGGKTYGALSVLFQHAYRVRPLFRVGAGNFHPPPAVRSVVLRVEPHEASPVEVHDEPTFVRLVKAAFQHRRKMLHHAVARLAGDDAGIIAGRTRLDLRRRAETLTLEEFARLANALWASRQDMDR